MGSNMAALNPLKPGILALTPKASRCRQVFWLSWFLPTFPSDSCQTVVIFGKTSLRIKEYSCGDSSRIKRDSLFVPNESETGNTVAIIQLISLSGCFFRIKKLRSYKQRSVLCGNRQNDIEQPPEGKIRMPAIVL
jgi:hypothetical protein